MEHKAFFKLRPLRSKTVFMLKGNFDDGTIVLIKRALQLSQRCNGTSRKCIEVNMKEVASITMKAMALLVITLKELKGKGVPTRVTGLRGTSFELASSLGMQYITPIS